MSNIQLIIEERSQRNKLIEEINIKGYNQVVEEVAYTWFNRFTALRFMEVNNYLPTKVKVLSSEIEGSYEPDIIKEALNIDLDIDKEFIWPDINSKETNTKGTCYGLRRQIGILVDGTVVPCCLDQDGEISLGNIFKEDLKDILNKEKPIKIIEGFRNKKLVEELCKRCGYIERFKK